MHVCFVHEYIFFSITEAKAVVIGPTDIYVKMGSEVVLTCIVSQGPHELGTIYWYRGKCIISNRLLFLFTKNAELNFYGKLIK